MRLASTCPLPSRCCWVRSCVLVLRVFSRCCCLCPPAQLLLLGVFLCCAAAEEVL